jgi:hypothetical protein
VFLHRRRKTKDSELNGSKRSANLCVLHFVMGTRGFFPGVKRPGHEADHSSPSSTEVNEWDYTSTTLIRLHSVVFN